MRFKLTRPGIEAAGDARRCGIGIRTRWCIGLGCLLAVVTVCRISGPAYARHQDFVALRRADDFLTQGKLRNASLSARQVLARNPTNLEACRIMAALSELSGSAQVLEWRRRIAQLAPSVETRLQLAAAALEVQPPPYALASELLSALAEGASNNVGYCNLSAQLALKMGRGGEAENWFAYAAQLEPSNHLHVFNRDILRLGATNTTTAHQARASLIELSAEPALTIPALRALIADSLVRRDLHAALPFSDRLQVQPQIQFYDRLVHLEILSHNSPNEFEPFLETIQSQSLTNAAFAADLTMALIRCGLAERAGLWLTHCPLELRKTPQLQLANAECSIALKDWPGLEKGLRHALWGDFEPMRLALLAQAALETGDRKGAELRWHLALKQARGKLGSLLWLLTRTEGWGRRELRIDVLWELSREFPSEQWALVELENHYLSTGNTARLHDLYAQRLRMAPADRDARNNFAATGLLLHANLAIVHDLARSLYAECPHNPVFASTFAYSLHVQGRTQQGLNILEQLPREDLSRPGIALYYGILLLADGQPSRAAEAFARARDSELLPEERRLLPPMPRSEAKP
jgi:hypothetical protein